MISRPFAVDSPFKYDSARFSQEVITSPLCVTQEMPIIRQTVVMKSQHLGRLCGKATLMIPVYVSVLNSSSREECILEERSLSLTNGSLED